MIQPVTKSVNATSFGSSPNFQRGITPSSSLSVRDGHDLARMKNREIAERQASLINQELRAQQITGANLNYIA